MTNVKCLRLSGAAALFGLGIAFMQSAPAHAEQPLATAITQGKAIIDVRTRFESVNDENCAACAGRHAEGVTVRARLGYETGYWNSLALAFDFDKVWALGGEHYNSTRNGKTLYPVIADPDVMTLNRLQITYATNFNTKFIIGRQRLLFGNQRFIGNSGWRDHEQTFDAVSVVNTSIKDLTATYVYVDRVNRIYGPDAPVPATGQASYFDSKSHLVNAVYVGVPTLRLEAYAYLFDFKSPGSQPTSTPNAKRLSTSTFGLRAEEKLKLSDKVTAILNGEYAHQSDHAGNPLQIDLNYWLVEGGGAFKGLTATAAYEVLEGNGTVGFSTPLATLHAYNGWADLFLTTPADGLTDLYGKASYVLNNPWGMKSLTATAFYHVFETERTSIKLGKEFDASLELAVDKNASFLLKYANFNGVGPFKDKTIFWVQSIWKL